MKTKNDKTFQLVMTAMFIALTAVSILFIRVPIPFTQGYVHLGDAVIFLGILVLGWRYGAIAAGIGGAMGDLLGGFAIWAPWTFAIKGLMAVIIGLILSAVIGKRQVSHSRLLATEVICMVVAGAFETAAYFAAEGIMYGNWATAALGVPWNIGQFAIGMAVAVLINAALNKTPARKYFTYQSAAGSSVAPSTES